KISAPSRASRRHTADPRFPFAPVTTTQRPSSIPASDFVDSATGCSQNVARDARARPTRRSLWRADRADADFGGHLSLRQARADRDPGAVARVDPLRRGFPAARPAALAPAPARTAASAAGRVEEDHPALVRGRPDQPGILFIWTTT